MSTSYDGTILDHLAEHVLYLSTASSFWFRLDSSYDHEFHLSWDVYKAYEEGSCHSNWCEH
jgi:hypothetical protein